MVVLITLESTQAHVTEATDKEMVHMLNYCSTRPDAVIRYKESNMILEIQSDTSYLSDPKAHS